MLFQIHVRVAFYLVGRVEVVGRAVAPVAEDGCVVEGRVAEALVGRPLFIVGDGEVEYTIVSVALRDCTPGGKENGLLGNSGKKSGTMFKIF